METNLEFVLPDARHRADVLGFYDEFRAQGETCIGYGGYEDFDAWLTGMRNRRTGTNLPEGYVPENFYLCYADGVLVGVLNLKFTLTAYLLHYGGHIGYAVRPLPAAAGAGDPDAGTEPGNCPHAGDDPAAVRLRCG